MREALVDETLVLEEVDAVTTVNALMILVPGARFARRGQQVEVEGTADQVARVRALIAELEKLRREE